MKYYLALLFVLFLQSSQMYAQKNELSIGANTYHFFNVIDNPNSSGDIPSDVLFIKYKRQLKKQFFTSIQLNSNHLKLITTNQLTTSENNYLDKNNIGKLTERLSYIFLDVSVGSNFMIKNTRHRFSLSGGLSYARGKNAYLDNVILAWVDPEHFLLVQLDRSYKQEAYLGGLVQLGYDFHILRNKLNIGIQCSGRAYVRGFPSSIWYGIHLGYLF